MHRYLALFMLAGYPLAGSSLSIIACTRDTPKMSTQESTRPLSANGQRQSAHAHSRPNDAQANIDDSNSGAIVDSLAAQRPDAQTILRSVHRANHDPIALGLKRAHFDLDYRISNPPHKTTATCRWHAGKLHISINEIKKAGKRVSTHNKVVYEQMEARIRSLLREFGHGFMTARLKQWLHAGASVAGKNARAGPGMIALQISDELGKTHVHVGKNGRVTKASHLSTKNIRRTMTYAHHLLDGRNAVRQAVLSITLPKSASDAAKTVLRRSQGIRFDITYTRVGKYWLVSRLDKRIPGMHTSLSLRFSYSTVE